MLSKLFALILSIFVLDLLLNQLYVNAKLEEKFSWKQLEFNWPNNETEQKAIQNGHYIPENNLPLGVQRWNNRLFITVPRWKPGVAATLNYIDVRTKEIAPKLHPYPSWEANTLPDNRQQQDQNETSDSNNFEMELENNLTIVSTVRVAVDECDRLWVMDNGLLDIFVNRKRIAPETIVIFDLKTDKLIRRYVIPKKLLKEDSSFVNIVVDSNYFDCKNTYAYLPDVGSYGLIVYNFKDNHSYRIKHSFFNFEPLQSNFFVSGINFQWTDAVFGIAVGPIRSDHCKDIYFHALASTKEFKVSNRVLQNETYVTTPAAYYDFKLVGDRGINGQSSAQFYDDETDVIFYTQVNKDAIGCWNVKRSYNLQNQGLVDINPVSLVFANDLDIDFDGTIWVLSNKMPQFLYKQLDPNFVNYRVLTGKNVDLIKGTPCEIVKNTPKSL